MKKIYRAAPVYILVTTLILLWWLIAFSPSKNTQTDQVPTQSTQKITFSASYTLSPLEREKVHEALTGDIDLMASLIAEWDFDAQILHHAGIKNIQRLSSEKLIKSQILKRQLNLNNKKQIEAFQEDSREEIVVDDLGKVFALQQPLTKFLPQTYVSASFLLALLPPEQIIAIPKDLREQIDLYPEELTKKIPLDIDRNNAEKIFYTKPELAFVAHYSSPSTIEALKEQGIPLFTITKIDTLPEIAHTLSRIGNIVNHPMEANLLNIFIESAMLNIDNRLAALREGYKKDKEPRIIYLNYVSQFSIPASHTLTGRLLHRAGVNTISTKDYGDKWVIPIEQEEIINLKPDYMIISTSLNPTLHKEIASTPAFALFIKNKPDNLAFVNANVQSSPSQFIVLAYLDLFQALSGAYSHD